MRAKIIIIIILPIVMLLWATTAFGDNIAPSYGAITIYPFGNFDGWAWGENIGWIRFGATKAYNVGACVVTLDDLANLALGWVGGVDNNDFARLAQH